MGVEVWLRADRGNVFSSMMCVVFVSILLQDFLVTGICGSGCLFNFHLQVLKNNGSAAPAPV